MKLLQTHCAFLGCCWTDDFSTSLESHIVESHAETLLRAEAEVWGERRLCYGVAWNLWEAFYSLNMHPTNALAGYYVQAIAEIARGVVQISIVQGNAVEPENNRICESISIVGPSMDRRAFGRRREVYNDSCIHSLICFVCAQRRTQTSSANTLRSLVIFSERSQILPFTFPKMVGGPEYFTRLAGSRRACELDLEDVYFQQFQLSKLPTCPKVQNQ